MNNQDKFLESESGFCMPFFTEEGDKIKELEILLDYGDQTHPKTGEKFFHNGVDFMSNHKPLYGLASGIVVSVARDIELENTLTVKYGNYIVKCGHLDNIFVNYGDRVVAGQPIAQCGNILHFEVRTDEGVYQPFDFLAILYGNINILRSMGMDNHPYMVTMSTPVKTKYDNDQEEIQSLMMRWLPNYFNDMQLGNYIPSQNTEQALRNIFSKAAERNYFFENTPFLGNPLGLGNRSSLLIGKVQSVIIEDFLRYMAGKYNIYLSSCTEEEKKN